MEVDVCFLGTRNRIFGTVRRDKWNRGLFNLDVATLRATFKQSVENNVKLLTKDALSVSELLTLFSYNETILEYHSVKVEIGYP